MESYELHDKKRFIYAFLVENQYPKPEKLFNL